MKHLPPFLIGLLLLLATATQVARAQYAITTGPLSQSVFCPQTAYDIPYTATGTFGTYNRFTAQLSDANGSFVSSRSIGSVMSTGSGVIHAWIPWDILHGTAYRIRVVSSNPVITGSDNGGDLEVGDIVPPVIAVKNVTLSIGVTGTATLTPDMLDDGSTDNCGITKWRMSGGPTGTACASASSEDMQDVWLVAPEGAEFTSVEFASFGTPQGSCGGFTIGEYHAPNSMQIIAASVIGATWAQVLCDPISYDYWPPPGVIFGVAVQATYTYTNAITFDYDDLGTHVIGLVVTDASGNSATANAVVNVVDPVSPVVTGPGSITAANDAGACGAVLRVPVLTGEDALMGTAWNSRTIHIFNKSTLEASGQRTMLISGLDDEITRTHGMSVHPVTGAVYAVVGHETGSGMARSLVRLDPGTGYGTLIGATGINVSGIAFDRDGVLYAIGGASGPGANKLHTLNLLTGAATYVMDVASGGGKGFAYNPDDGLFYHKYYLAPTHGFEKIDPLLQTRSSITLSGDAVAPDVTGMTYAGDGVFLASGGPWYSISSTGTVTQRTEGGDWFKGLLFNSLPNALRIIDNSPVTVTQNAGVASGGFFPVGTTTNTYTVTDASMNAATYTLSVTVEDVEAPVLVPLAGPIMRVRNNINNCGSSASNYEEFPVGGLYASVSDNCGATVRVLSVSSDEADDNDGNGDGCTEEDVDNMYVCDRVELRIECDGGLDGRVYTILLEARDPAGNTAGVPCYVHVKKNAASNVVEGPALYTLPCPNTGSAKQWISRAVPALPSLEQNYPNPFNPVTEIRFVLPSQGRALLQVIDIHGRVLRSLVDENFTAGPHVAVFEAADLPSGVYLYRLQFGGRVLTRSMVLLR